MRSRWAAVRGRLDGSLSLVALAALLEVSSAGSVAAQAVPLDPFDLPPGATVTLTFEVDVDSPLGACAGAIANQGRFFGANFSELLTDDPDTVVLGDPTLTGLDVVDLAISKTDGAVTEVPGTSVSYTIVVTNDGPSPAVGATVSDTFPAALTGVSWTCTAGPGASCTAGPVAGNLADLVGIPAGGSVTYTVNATVAAGAGGSLVNTATVAAAASQVECDLADNTSTDTDTLTPQVDLSITKTDGRTSIDAGTATSYTLVITNSGPSDAVGATVADSFPAELTGVSWTCAASGGSSCTAGPVAGNVNDSVTVRAGGTLTYTVNATVAGTASGTLSNTATVAAPGGTTDTNAANNSATDTTTINPVADLSITKDDGVTTAVPGLSVTYTIVAANAGPATATGASVADAFPGVLSCTWTCVAAGGATCTAGPVSGDVADSADLPAGASATYTAVCNVADGASGTLVNTATISGGGVSDGNAANNSATDTDTLLPLDYGDAPDSALAAPSGYPTLLADDGARHGVNGAGALKLGAAIDTEADGQPTVDADGDDLAGTDDEDGVTLPAFLLTCEEASVTVVASAASRLDAWVDFDADGSFAGAGEKVFDDLALAAGSNALAFTVPCTATVVPGTFARFRVSSAGGLGPEGVAADGEVEDYALGIRGLDFGDAPDPAYPTLFASDGARHVITGSGPVLGALGPDAEADGQPTAGATGDDANGIDDEDGVTFPAPLVPGQSADVTVTASAAGLLNAWIDFGQDGSFAQAGDRIFTDEPLAAGANGLSFSVPASAATNASLVARFRLATDGGLSFNGLAADGEVEDHTVAVVPVADLAITKTDGSATEVPGTPVTYTVTVSNPGPDGVVGASVADVFPAAISGVSWTCVGAGGGTCTAGPGAGDIADLVNLPVGASVTYTATGDIDPAASGTLSNTATVTAPAGTVDPNRANDSATDVDTLAAETDLSVTKTDGTATAVPGAATVYTIVVANAGPSNATGATVNDAVPAGCAGFTWTCAAGAGASCTAGPVNGAISDAVSLEAGTFVTYTATCTVTAGATGTLVNTVTVAPAGGTTDPMPADNSATDTDTLTPQADLTIAKTDGSATEVPGTSVTYTITVSNSGPSNATGATVSDTFPATITGVSWTCVAAGGASCTAGPVAGNVNDLVNVPVSGTLTYTATGTIQSSATGSLANTATVAPAGGTTDPVPGNNSATDSDTLVASADLAITKEDSADPPPAGEDLVYTISVENLGPSDATGVMVTDPLPGEVTYVSDDCGGSNTPPWTWNVGTLPDGATATCNVTVSIDPGPPAAISNTASVTASTADPVSGNDSDTEETLLDAVPPQVVLVDSLAATGGGELAECETARVSLTRLFVTFSEEMANPPGNAGAGDVTSPSSYLVLRPGPDLAFDTAACGPLAGDDEVVTVTSVSYSDVTQVATLVLPSALPDGLYRLHACGSLQDLAGNGLDGDGDNTGGDDFVRGFRVDAANRFANGHLDCDLAGWTVVTPTPGEIAWDGDDAQGSPHSGSAAVTNLNPGIDTRFELNQCVEVGAGLPWTFGTRFRLSAAPGPVVTLQRTCRFFSAPACASGPLGTVDDVLLMQDTGGAWLSRQTQLTSPAGTQSVRCRIFFDTPAGPALDGGLDGLTLAGPQLIFADGFESGNASQWSVCQGPGCP